MEPYYNTIDKICDHYHQAKSQGTGSDNISEVATAAAAGKVDTLLIEAEPKFGHDNKRRRQY
jgi:hypothetical protein